jgi:hypothetical protein
MVDATSAMQIAPTIVMVASLAPIERFENKVVIFGIPIAHSAMAGRPGSGVPRPDDFGSVNLKEKY